MLFALYAHPAAYPPVERAAEVFVDAGWQVRIVGARGTETDALATKPLSGVDVRLVSRAGQGLVQKVRYVRFLLTCLTHLAWWRPDWVYVSDSFATPFGVAATLAGARTLYHEHDAPIDEGHSRFVRAILAARGWLLRRARIVVTPNEQRSAAAAREGGGREVLTVWNCPARAEVRAHAHRDPSAPLRVVYHGSIGRDRPPAVIVDAMAAAGSDARLEIAGYETVGSRGMVATIVARAEALGVADRVAASGPMPRVALLERAASCDLGLSLMPMSSPNFNEITMAGASNKAFEYLACGVPIIVSDMPDWQRMFVDRGVAFAADPEDTTALTRILRHAAEHREELAAMGERGQQLIVREWNYETQFGRVIDEIERQSGAPKLPKPRASGAGEEAGALNGRHADR